MKYSFLLCIIIAAACTKHKGDVEENIPFATISITSPAAGAVYHNGDSVHILAKAISTAVIHGYDVMIRKAGDTTNYFFKNVHDHNDTLIIDQQWKCTLSGTDMEAIVKLYLDHDGHTGEKRVGFRVN